MVSGGGGGAVSRLVARVSWALFKRQRVGVDELGNAYYRQLDKNMDGDEFERRTVKYSADIDPTALPAEWHQWLHKARADPPTDDDIQRGQHQRQLFRQRVAALDAEDAKRRFQEQTGSSGGGGGFVQQLPDGQDSQPR